ncbi:MAG: diaminopimelate epimerase [Gemmatimonadetes bacterium]|nr:diaminopimelate epimerase [Gemmatimonadota bacterium]
MTGSGNDFVFFDNRDHRHDDLATPGHIAALCDRRRGIGADGIVLLDADPEFDFGMRYYNRDGSLAEMCGNAALCSARLATTLGMVAPGPFRFRTPSGPVTARLTEGTPEIDMTPVTDLQADAALAREPGEQRIGFARVGVPHLVVLVDDLEAVDVERRGRALRHDPSLPQGANVNFVARRADGWAMRTYERGVEAETLACGTGTVATVALLNAWTLAHSGLALHTRCGVDLFADMARGGRAPVLRGEGRIVATGTIVDLPE